MANDKQAPLNVINAVIRTADNLFWPFMVLEILTIKGYKKFPL